MVERIQPFSFDHKTHKFLENSLDKNEKGFKKNSLDEITHRNLSCNDYPKIPSGVYNNPTIKVEPNISVRIGSNSFKKNALLFLSGAFVGIVGLKITASLANITINNAFELLKNSTLNILSNVLLFASEIIKNIGLYLKTNCPKNNCLVKSNKFSIQPILIAGTEVILYKPKIQSNSFNPFAIVSFLGSWLGSITKRYSKMNPNHQITNIENSTKKSTESQSFKINTFSLPSNSTSEKNYGNLNSSDIHFTSARKLDLPILLNNNNPRYLAN